MTLTAKQGGTGSVTSPPDTEYNPAHRPPMDGEGWRLMLRRARLY